MAEIGLVIKADGSNAQQQLVELQRAGTNCADILGQGFNTLGAKLDTIIQGQRDAYVAAFEKIKSSGVASAAEIVRSQDALVASGRNYQEQLREMQLAGSTCASVLEREFSSLGIKSNMLIQGQRDAYVSSFATIKNSGVASAAEISRAQDALNAKLSGLDKEEGIKKADAGAKGLSSSITSAGGCVERLNQSFSALNATAQLYFVGGKLWSGFKAGIDAVDSFQMSIVQTAALITSFQGPQNVAENYRLAKQYATELQDKLLQINSRTFASAQDLSVITMEMFKQGVMLNTNNKNQLDGFVNMANAAMVVSQGSGNKEIQLRQEVRALMMGQVDAQSVLAGQLNAMVGGDLKKQVENWKQQGTLLEHIGSLLSGYAAASGDIQGMWGSIKTTTSSIVIEILRDGFAPVLKDLSAELENMNKYFKAHKELLGKDIKNAWDDIKIGMKIVAGIFETILAHTTTFGILLTAGAVVQGLTMVTGMFVNLKTAVTLVRDGIIGMNAAMALTPAAAAPGVVAGAAEGVGAGAATGGIIGAVLSRIAPLLSKLAIPTGIGAFAYMMSSSDSIMGNDEEMAKVKAKTGSAAGGGVATPKIVIPDTEEQIKKRITDGEKTLADFKAQLEQKSALVKGQGELELSYQKGQYDQGLVATRSYYDEAQQVALAAAQLEFKNASDYLNKVSDFRDMVLKQRKGKTDSEDYLKADAAYQKGLENVQKTELDYGKTWLKTESDKTNAVKALEQESLKLGAEDLDRQGRYLDAEKMRQNAEKETAAMVKLAADDKNGYARKELEWQGKLTDAEIKDVAAVKSMMDAENALQDQRDKLNGVDQTSLDLRNKLRDGLQASLSLTSQLTAAENARSPVKIAQLKAEKELQDALNGSAAEAYNLELRKNALSGKTVGFVWNEKTKNYDQIAATGWQSVTPYQTDKSLMGGSAAAASGDSTVSNNGVVSGFSSNSFTSDPYWNTPATVAPPILAVGTPYVNSDGLAYLHQGEAVLTADTNKKYVELLGMYKSLGGTHYGDMIALGDFSSASYTNKELILGRLLENWDVAKTPRVLELKAQLQTARDSGWAGTWNASGPISTTPTALTPTTSNNSASNGNSGVTVYVSGGITVNAGTTSDPKQLARALYGELQQLGTRYRQ